MSAVRTSQHVGRVSMSIDHLQDEAAGIVLKVQLVQSTHLSPDLPPAGS